FFQAEDGIRDRNVTGVQTCALPIFGGWFPGGRWPLEALGAGLGNEREWHNLQRLPGGPKQQPADLHDQPHGGEEDEAEGGVAPRSEERRVGKEWRCQSKENSMKIRR